MSYIDTISFPELIELDATTSITLNIQKIVLETVNTFFLIESGEDGYYGLSIENVNLIDSSHDNEKTNKYFEIKGIPNTKEPGLSQLIDKFAKSIAKSVLFFAKQFVAMKEAALGLIQALKNPTKPSNVKIIKQIIEKLKGIIEEIKLMFTETINWMKKTFLGPLAEVNVPTPSFIFNLGEIVPAFPFPLPMPEVKPSNLDNLNVPKIENDKINVLPIKERLNMSFGYENPSNLALINIYKNTPYLQNVDTNLLVDNTFKDSISDKEKGASDLKRVNLFKSLATSPLKVVLSFINALLGAVIGLISFDFSKITELTKMMIPNLEGVEKLTLKILNGIIPNVSKILEKNKDVKPPNNQTDLKNQINKVKNTHIDNLEYDGFTENDLKIELDKYNKIVNDIIEYKNNITIFNNEKPLENYINNIKSITKELRQTENKINEILSDISMPNTLQINEKTILINEIISNVNSIDSKIDDNFNFVDNKFNENIILEYFDNIKFNIDSIDNYENNIEINNFFNFYNNVEHFPLNINEISDYIENNKKLINLDIETINNFFTVYDEVYINNNLEKINDAINYVKKLKYIKYTYYNNLNEFFIQYKDLLVDFLNNDIILINNIYFQKNINYNFTELELKYNQILNFINDELYSSFNDSTAFINISLSILNNFSTLVNGVENMSFSFSKLEINNLINNINIFLELDNYNELLFITYNISTLNYTEIENDYFKENIIIQYLTNIKNLFSLQNELIEKDKSISMFDDNNNKINDSIRNKLIEFLINIIEKTKQLEENNYHSHDILDDCSKSFELEKTLKETNPNKDALSSSILQLSNLAKTIPLLLLSILIEIFNYALEGLPSFLGG